MCIALITLLTTPITHHPLLSHELLALSPLPLSSGENRITWPTGCCEGDLVVSDFYDQQGDGNEGEGMLSVESAGTLNYHIR